MRTKVDVLDILEDKTLMRMMELMDKSASEAETQWRSQLSKAGSAKLPSDFISKYKVDGTQFLKAMAAYDSEWLKVSNGRGDPKKLLSTLDNYSTSLDLLWTSNTRCEALLDIDIAAKTAGWLATLMVLANVGVELELAKTLSDLRAELVKAEHEVIEAHLKRALNVTLSAITIALPKLGDLAKYAVVASSITAHMIIDDALGHGTVPGKVVFVLGDGADAIHFLGHVVPKLIGFLAAVETYRLDTNEVEEAEEVVDKLRPMCGRAKKELNDFMSGVRPLEPKLRAANAGIKKCIQEIGNAMATKCSADKNYDYIRNAIKKAL